MVSNLLAWSLIVGGFLVLVAVTCWDANASWTIRRGSTDLLAPTEVPKVEVWTPPCLPADWWIGQLPPAPKDPDGENF